MTDKLKKMEEHLSENPHDYQTAIAYMKEWSREVDRQRKYRINMERKRLADVRRKLYGKQT